MPAGAPPSEGPGARAPLRPRLLPASRWGRIALALLILAALCRSLAFASTQPGWYAPDEDYHWLYAEYLVIKHRVPDLNGPFATNELFASVTQLRQGDYVRHPRSVYRGDPHATVAALDRLSGKLRQPTGERPRQVLHAPLWHIGAAAVDRSISARSPVTRLTAMRYWSALLGALGVLFAWLLAAQVLARLWEQLAATALVVFQPIVAFSSGTLSNDVLVLATFTATLAWCAFLLRTPSRPRQGIGLGLALAAALLSKSTALSLVPLVGLALLALWRTNPGSGRAVAGIAAWAAGIAAVLAGPWYLYVLVKTHTLLGGTADTAASTPGAVQHGITYIPRAAYRWFAEVYPGYWFNYEGFLVHDHDGWYYLPLAIGCIGIAGLLAWLWANRHDVLTPGGSAARQALLLIAAPLILLAPPLGIDVSRALNGAPFYVQQARFLTPAYPALAVLFVLGVAQLAGRRRAAHAAAVAGVVIVAAVFYWHTYLVWSIERYYGSLDGGLITLLRHASWDKPEWVGPGWLLGLFGVSAVATVAALAVTFASVRREAEGQAPPVTGAPQTPGPPAA